MAIKALFEAMQQQIQHHKALAKLLEKQQEAVGNRALEELEKVTDEMQVLLLSLRNAEQERMEEHVRICQELAIAEDSTLVEVVGKLPPGQSQMLAKLGDNLKEVINNIQDTQEQNKELLSQSLNFLNFSLNLLTQDEHSTTYGKDGAKDSKKRTVINRNM